MTTANQLSNSKTTQIMMADNTNRNDTNADTERYSTDGSAYGVTNADEILAVDNPFATRAGKALLWRKVNMTLKPTMNKPERTLLQDVWGEVPERQTTAIMGPSGAGKTSLLNILAGRAASRGRLHIESDVRLNNYVVDPANIHVRQNIAFVAQDDSLQITQTPREAIYFSAKLRLPKSTPEESLHKLVNKMLNELGLTHCADTIVGGALVKGISGGERKRTSVGVELVVKPAMVFLDEPTSGLDSFSAVQLCQVLKKVANAGSSVLFTIHQPSSEIFKSFDRLILLNKGRVMYQGAVQDIPAYFAERKHPVPLNYNPADWIMNVAQSVSIEQLNKDGFFPTDDRSLPEPFVGGVDGKDELGLTLTKRSEHARDAARVGMVKQISMLLQRDVMGIFRDFSFVGARLGLAFFLSLLIGIIFWQVGTKDPAVSVNLNSQFGVLIMTLLPAMMSTAQPSLLAFPTERPVFLREYSTNHYSVISYFLSRLAMEASITAAQVLLQVVITYFMVGLQGPFGMIYLVVYVLAMSSTAIAVLLGCSIEDPKTGQEMLPLLFAPQMLFAGFFVAPDLIPIWLRWARYLCALTYALRIILVEEFNNGDCGDSEEANRACGNLLERLDATGDETWWNWLVLAGLFVVFRVVALVVLQRKATKFF